MPIFTRTFDFLSWLVPATQPFSARAALHRDAAAAGTPPLICASGWKKPTAAAGRERLEPPATADEALAKVRYYLRLAQRWGWLSAGQYQHVAGMVAEIGRLLGGWKKAQDDSRGIMPLLWGQVQTALRVPQQEQPEQQEQQQRISGGGVHVYRGCPSRKCQRGRPFCAEV